MTKNSRSTSNGQRLALLALAFAGAGSAYAANAVADAKSTVVTPIQISKSTDLVFGSFTVGAAGGTVTVSTAGARGNTGDVILMSGAGSAAKFDVTGEGGKTYSISLATTPLARDGGGGTPMNFTVTSDIASGTLAGVGPAGAQSFFVGGELTVAANQAAGGYTGSVTATVDYN